MRLALALGTVFVALAGIQLYVLADHTDRLFAWTIAVPLTAAFLGGFYLTACAIAYASWRRREWANARVGVPGVMVFLIATLTTTLAHLDLFHLHDPRLTARSAAWLWLAIYIADPVLVAVAWIVQLREPGSDPPRTRPLPPWYLGSLGAAAALTLCVGVALFVRPSTAGSLWPWPLTPLTAQTAGAWLTGIGIVFATAIVERDAVRIRPAAAGAALLGVLQALALVRYGSTVRWGSPAACVYILSLAGVVVIGVAGVLLANRTAVKT